MLFELLAKDRACRPADAGLVAWRLEQMLALSLATDDPVEVGVYVAGLFTAERQALQARVAQVSVTEPAPRAPGRRVRRRLAWGALAGGSVLAAVLAIAAGWRTKSAAETTPDLTAAKTISAAVMTADRSPPPTGLPAAAAQASPAPARPARKRRAGENARSRAGRTDARAAAAQGCDPPYTVNASGERQFKLRCLVDVRR